MNNPNERDGGFSPLGNWSKDFTTGDFGNMNMSMFLESSPPGPSSPDSPARIPSGGITTRKRSRGLQKATSETLESLSAYVREEFLKLMARVTNLESIVNGLVSEQQQDAVAVDQAAPALKSNRKLISRGHLDRFCLPVLEHCPEPSVTSLTRIAQQMELLYEQLDRKAIMSQLRRWFRKRREEMGGRVASSIRRHYSDSLRDNKAIQALKAQFEKGEVNLGTIMKDARLEITDPGAAATFTKQKVLSFLARYRPAE